MKRWQYGNMAIVLQGKPKLECIRVPEPDGGLESCRGAGEWCERVVLCGALQDAGEQKPAGAERQGVTRGDVEFG